MVPLFDWLFPRLLSSSSMLDEAKRWFEASTVICRFVPGGKECAEKVRQIRLYWLSIGVYLEPLTDGRGPVHLRFQKLIPIFFHAMGQNVELQEDIGLSTGRLDSDMRTSLDSFCLDCLSISIFSTSALITALLLFCFLRTVLFCLLYAKPGLYVCLIDIERSGILLSRRTPAVYSDFSHWHPYYLYPRVQKD